MSFLNLKKSSLINRLSENIISKNGLIAFMLCSLSAQLESNGSRTPFTINTGYQKPQFLAVFLCPLKIFQAVSIRLKSVMVGCGKQLLPSQCFGNCWFELATVRRLAIRTKGRGLSSLNTGVTAMKTSVITLIHELKSEIAALRAEIAALKAEKSNPNNTTAAKVAHSVDQSQPKTKHDRIIRLPEALKITGFKKTSFYAKLKQGLFKKIQLSERSVGFFESEIYAFVQSLSTAGGVA